MTLKSHWYCQSSSVSSTNGTMRSVPPAMLIKMSGSVTVSVTTLQPAAVATSPTTVMTLAPETRSRIAAAAFSSRSSVRPLIQTLAPRAARPWAVASPIPLTAAVTSALLPLRSKFIIIMIGSFSLNRTVQPRPRDVWIAELIAERAGRDAGTQVFGNTGRLQHPKSPRSGAVVSQDRVEVATAFFLVFQKSD